MIESETQYSADSIKQDYTTLETFRDDFDYLNKRINALTELNILKDKECQEARTLIIDFFEENIKLERELNKVKAESNMLLVDFKQNEEEIKSLKLSLSEKENELLRIKLEFSVEKEKFQLKREEQPRNQGQKSLKSMQKSKNLKPTYLQTISKLKTRNSFTKNACSKVRKVYESRIVELLKSARKEVKIITLNDSIRDQVKNEQTEATTQTIESSIENNQPDVFKEAFCDIDIIEHNIEKNLLD